MGNKKWGNWVYRKTLLRKEIVFIITICKVHIYFYPCKSVKSVSKYYNTIIFITSLLFLSCNNKSEIRNDFNCENTASKNLEKVEDVKELFSIDLPKDWKINLYEDEIQSSILLFFHFLYLAYSTTLIIIQIPNSIIIYWLHRISKKTYNIFIWGLCSL